DLPLRFGDQPIRRFDFGQSSISASSHDVSVGLTTQDEWWGPGIRNTLIMSNNAPGIPRAFARTARPVRTRAGAFEARIIAGTVTESRFFDTLTANDYRSISGLLVTFRPAVDSGLTLGLSRVVYAPIARATGSLSHAIDDLTKWEPLARATDTLANGRNRQSTDQLLSLFA